MPPSTTRRRLLRAAPTIAIGTGLAGCNQSNTAGSDTTSDTTTSTTTTAESGPAALVHLERASYIAKAWTLPDTPYGLPRNHVVAFPDLPDPVRDAVRTAIESPPYTTTDASNAFLDAIETVHLVEYEGTVYAISHTFPTVTIRLDTDITADEATDARTATFDSDDVASSQAVENLLYTIATHGVETEPRPYETTRLDPAIRDFLDQYDYVESPVDVGELVVTRTNRSPPHTVRAREATDEDLYGREIRDLSEYGPPTRELVDRLLASDRKTPANPEDRIHTTYPDAVPREFARDLDAESNYVRVDDRIHGFDTRHVHWSDLPLEVDATVTGADEGGPVDVTLAIENTGDDRIQFRMTGLAPFGVLWAYGPGGEYVLWHDGYTERDAVVVEDGAVVPEFTDQLTLLPGQSRSETYRLGHDALDGSGDLQSGTYEVLGTIWPRWPPYEGADEYDWRSQLFPYTLTIDVA